MTGNWQKDLRLASNGSRSLLKKSVCRSVNTQSPLSKRPGLFLLLAILVFSLSGSVKSVVPIRLYENVHPTTAAVPNTVSTSSAASQAAPTYSSSLPSGIEGYIWSWSDASANGVQIVKLFNSKLLGSITELPITGEFTGVSNVRTSLYLASAKCIIAGTDTGISFLWLETYDPLLTSIAMKTGSTPTNLASSGTLVSNMGFHTSSSTTYLYWTAADAGLYGFYRTDTSTITYQAVTPPTATLAGAFTAMTSANSPLVWIPVGTHFFVFKTLDTDPGLMLIDPTNFAATTFSASFVMTKGIRHVVMDLNSPAANGDYTFYAIDYTSAGTFKPGTGIHQFTFTYDTGTLANSVLGPLTSTTITGDFVSNIILIKNTKYVAAVVGVPGANTIPTYSVRVFDTEAALAEVTSFGSLILQNYEPFSLTPNPNKIGFTNESPFAFISKVDTVSSVRSLFFLTDACKAGQRANDICAECQVGYVLNNNLADNECVPIAYEIASTSLAIIPRSCQSPNCLSCSSGTTTKCLKCQDTAFRSEDTPEYSCYKSHQEIEDGFGYNAATNRTSPCIAENSCKACRANYTTCESCVTDKYLITSWRTVPSIQLFNICIQCTGATPFIKVSASGLATVCVAANNIERFGLDTSVTAVQILKDCKPVANCLTCNTNMNSCLTCPPDTPYLVTQGGLGSCYTLNNIPDGFGADTSSPTPKTKPCATGCKSCKLDSTICTECLGTVYKRQINSQVFACYLTAADIPTGYGPDVLNSLNLIACVVTSQCASCANVYNICAACKPGSFVYTPSGGNPDCYGAPPALAIPAGYGPDIAGNSGTLKACPSCATCPNDHRYCVTCASDKYYLDTTGQGSTALCVDIAGMPEGYGADLNPNIGAILTGKKCSMSKCKLCAGDYLGCTECLPGTTESPVISYTTGGNLKCWSYLTEKSSVPAGVGLDKTNSAVFIGKTCAPSSGTVCATCLENYLNCDTCAATDYKQTVGGLSHCYAPGSFPDGYGPNLLITPKTIVPCQSSLQCKQCVDSYQACSTCESTGSTVIKYVYNQASVLTKYQCILPTDTATQYGKDPSEPNSLKPCLAGNGCEACPDDYKKCTICPANQYLLDDGAGIIKCVTQAQIPVGKGAEMDPAQGAQARALDCQITSCAKCSANYKTTCTECTGVLYLSALGPDVLLPRCVDTAGIPTGYRGTTNRLTEECTTDDCAACPAAAATCTQCKTTFYLHSPDGECYSADEPIVGYRFDTSGVTQACTPNCKVCTAASNTCEMCADTYYLTGGLCYTASLIPDGVGFNNGNQGVQLLVACSVGSCQKCANNHNQCALCSGSNLVHFDGSAWSCVSSLPSGYGNDPASNPPIKTIACTGSNCDTCSTDYTICTACKAGTSTYLYDTASTCLTKAQFPTGFGLNTATNKVAACSTSNCETCPDTIATCTKCQNSKGFYMKGTNSCIQKSEFAIGEGVNPTTLLVETCTDTNCSDCIEDNTMCKKCKTELGFYLLKTQCISKTQLTAGQGINAASGTVESCASGFCVDCFDNFKKCIKCTNSEDYTLSAGFCYDAKKQPAVNPQQVRVKLSSGSVNIPLGPDQSRVIDQVTVTDLLKGQKYSGAELGITITFTNSGMSLSFATKVQIRKGSMRIDRKPSAERRLSQNSRVLIDASPIVIDDFVLVQSSWVTTLTEALSIILNILRLPASIVLFWKYPWTSMIVDTMVTQVLLMGLIGTDTLAYPRIILEMVAGLKIFPFRFKNPFLFADSADSMCTPQAGYASLGFYCDWLDNYGENFIALLSILLLVVIIHYVLEYFMKKSTPGTRSAAALALIHNHYGPKFFVAKLDSNHLEVLLFTLVSFASGSTTGKGIVGAILGSLFSLVVLGIALIKTRHYFSVLDNPTNKMGRSSAYSEEPHAESTSLQPSSGNPNTAVEAKRIMMPNPQSLTWLTKLTAFVTYVSEDRRAPTTTTQAVYYPIRYLRGLLFVLIALNLSKTAWVLMALGSVLELLYLLFNAKYGGFLIRLEHYTQIGFHTLTIFYLILKAISTSDGLSDTVKHDTFGNLLAVVLVLLIALPIFLIFCAFLDMLYPFMKPAQSAQVTERDISTSKQQGLAKESISQDPQIPHAVNNLEVPRPEHLDQDRSPDQHSAKQNTAAGLPSFFGEVRGYGLTHTEDIRIGKDEGCLTPPADLSGSMHGGQHLSPAI